LYIVCRRDNTPHILLDFSEVTDCNVFVLGSTFVSLCRSLNIQFETIIDPCIFIWRYAKKLEFGSHIKVVVDSALDLVKRMKRDWIHVGRRPDSICGAALLIAARMHNFSRSVSEIVEVVRCCDMTLRKRLSEFEVTPSASLAVSEFESIFLEEECDPPAFSRLREKSHLQVCFSVTEK
jgi:transcription factor IIIB subunit 2